MASVHVRARRHRPRSGCSSPRSYAGDQWLDTTWDDALAVYAGLTKKILDNDGPQRLCLRLLRPRRRRRRLREHLGHRQAHVHGAADADGAHPQPAGLQLRMPCHARHGCRRAQQQLRGRGAGRRDRRHRHQRLRDPDQLLPERTGCRTCRAGRSDKKKKWFPGEAASAAAKIDHRRSAPHADGRDLRADRRQGQRAAPGHRAGHRHRPVQRACSPTSSTRAGTTSEFIAQVHERLRRRRCSQPACRSRRRSQHHRHPGREAAAGGRVGLQAKASGTPAAHACTPTRRASSGATTTT